MQPLEGNHETDVAPSGKEFDTPALAPVRAVLLNMYSFALPSWNLCLLK